MDFKLVSDFQPTGDQPEAIEALVAGLARGDRSQTLLGVTGTGKTFTMANVIAALPAPDARAGAEPHAGGAALLRVQGVLPGERRRVLRLVLRLLPARGVHPAHRHLHRQGRRHQRGDRQAAPRGHARAVRAPGRAHRRLRVLHLRPRRAGGVPELRRERARRASASTARASCAGSSTCSTSATT